MSNEQVVSDGVSERTVGIVLYPRFTALDAIGPYEVLSRIPLTDCIWIAETAGPVRADRGATLVPDATFENAPPLGVLVVPGGPGQAAEMGNERLMAYLRDAAAGAEVVASVCTGSLLLAQAGLLAGRKATTHWLAHDILAGLGATPVNERIVEDGVITAAGVSAGIDLGLALAARLAGDFVAQAIQLGIEYDPQPPFDTGSPDKAPPELVSLMRANARRFLEE